MLIHFVRHLISFRARLQIIGILILSFTITDVLAQQDTVQLRLDKLNSIEKVTYLKQIANSYLHVSPKKALTYAERALEIAKNEEIDSLIVIQSLQIASISFQEGNYDQAMNMNLDILRLSKEKEYDKGMSNAYNNIGNIYFIKGDLDQAFKYYSSSLEIEMKMAHDLGIGESYENIGLVLTNQKKYDESLRYFSNALEKYKKLNKNDYLPQLYNNIGIVYRSQKNWQKALEYFQLALKLNQELGQTESIAYNWQNIGAIDLEQNQIANALEGFKKSNEIGNEFRHLVKDNYEYLAEAYSRKKDFDKAYDYQKKFTQLNDSLFSRESEQRIAEMESKYQSEQKQKEIELLQKNNQIQNLEISKKDIMIYTISLIAILTIGLAWLFYNRYTLKHKSNILLTKANEQINQSMQEKEVLLQEVHHRVKNNLQLVSSLLAWQSEFIEDKKMQELIEENISRIKSMAFIHENLYMSPSLAKVSVKEYLHQIIDHLQKSFDGHSKVQLDCAIAPSLLNAEKIVPVGLIVNELISNVYKHAFNREDLQQISISFEERTDSYRLRISDTGQGLPLDYQERSKKSLGLQLVTILVRQLKGELKVQTQNPTVFEITF